MGGRWLDSFDDTIKSIYLNQEKAPEDERIVRVVEREDGPSWAEGFMERKPEIIAQVKKLIEAERIPQGSQEKALRELRQKGEIQAVRTVLRDLRNHIRAKELSTARVPFFSQNDGAFFRLLEESGEQGTTMSSSERVMVVHPKLGHEINRLLERLRYPEKVPTFDIFVGSSIHEELSEWFGYAADAAETVLPQDLENLLEERLREYIEAGRLREDLADQLRLGSSTFASGRTTDGLITQVARLALDSTGVLDLPGLNLNVMPIKSGISKEINIVSSDYRHPQWPFLSSFGKRSTGKELAAVP